MRPFHKITIVGFVISSPFLLTPNALAADQNTYRAGTPYLKTITNHHTQCESQCSGDAACRSWNFIRPNAGAASGVCELNARAVTPIPSRFSMSGIVNAGADVAMNKIVLAGTNTIRVGTPPVPKIIANQPRRTTVKREALPKQKIVRRANYTRPVSGRSLATQIGQRNPSATPKLQRPQNIAPQQQRLTPEQAYYRQQYLAHKQQQAAFQQQRQQNMQRPQVMRQAPPNANAPRQTLGQPIHQPLQLMRPQPSLYGSLHDDLTQNMTAVSRPKTAPDNLKNTDAPLSTSRAVPTKPVATQILKAPVSPKLVGGK